MPPAEWIKRFSFHFLHSFWTNKIKPQSTATLTRTALSYVALLCQCSLFPSNASSSSIGDWSTSTLHYGIFLNNCHAHSDMPSLVMSTTVWGHILPFCLALCDFLALHFRIPPRKYRHLDQTNPAPIKLLLAANISARAISKLSQIKYPVLNTIVTAIKLRSTVLLYTKTVPQPLFQERKGYSNYTKSWKGAHFHYNVHAKVKTICAVVALLSHQ